MEQRISAWLSRVSRGWVVLAALVIFFLFTALVLAQQATKAAQETGGAPVPWLSQSPEAAAWAMLRGIERDRETIHNFWLLWPMLLFNPLFPFARRRYHTVDGRVQRRHWADQAKSESDHEP